MEELFDTNVFNPEHMISYCRWKNVDKRFEEATSEEIISSRLQNRLKKLFPYLPHTFIQICSYGYFGRRVIFG